MVNIIKEYAYSLRLDRVGVYCPDPSVSFLVVNFPYFSGYTDNANISCYTYSRDYHIIVREYLEKLANFLRSFGYECSCHVDIGEKVDKKLAYLAGLGFYGRNSLIIDPIYGSYVFIGYLKVSGMLSEDKVPVMGGCMGCNMCRQVCDAFEKGIEYCASYITQKKGDLSAVEKGILKENGLIWGCDRCQKVCPCNKNARYTTLPEFLEHKVSNITGLSELSNKQFKNLYGDRAFAYKGKNILIRNFRELRLEN